MNQPNDLKRYEMEALLPAYVLGSLSSDEMHNVDSYIRQQRDFLTRLQKIEESSALLAHIAKPVVPPPHVRRTILMIARLDAPSDSVPTTPTPTTSTAIQPYQPNAIQNGQRGNGHNGYSNGHTTGYANGHANGLNGNGAVTYAIAPYRPPASLPTRQSRAMIAGTVRKQNVVLRLWQVAAVSALIVVLGISLLGLLLNYRLNETLIESRSDQTKIDTLMQTNNQLMVEKAALSSQNQQLANQQTTLTQQVTDSQQRLNLLTSAEQATALRDVNGAGRAQAMVYRTGTGFVIVANGLAELQSDRTYQLWTINSFSTAKPIAVFTVQANEGTVWREFAFDTANLNYNAMVLSIEQLGGNSSPTTVVMRSVR